MGKEWPWVSKNKSRSRKQLQVIIERCGRAEWGRIMGKHKLRVVLHIRSLEF
jgi:hypothetical protein